MARCGRFRVVSIAATTGGAVFRERYSTHGVRAFFFVALHECSSHGKQHRGAWQPRALAFGRGGVGAVFGKIEGGFISLSYLPEELVATIIQVAADVRRLPLHSVLGPYGTANLVRFGSAPASTMGAPTPMQEARTSRTSGPCSPSPTTTRGCFPNFD